MVKRLAASAVLVVTVVACLAPQAGASPTKARGWVLQLADLDHLVNTLSYDAFGKLHHRVPAQYRYLDWSTDDCSAGPIGESPFDFSQACRRHDLSWRNLKRITSKTGHPEWNERNKYVADQRLYNDMQARCSTFNVFVEKTCDAAALGFYKAVRTVKPFASDETLSDSPHHFAYSL